jgi:polysaccharide chain length determinant protein (PEP-CTERM system associated)
VPIASFFIRRQFVDRTTFRETGESRVTTDQALVSGSRDQGALEIRQYLEILRRRKAIVLLTAIGVFFCTAVIARRLPNVYRSETVILVDAQQVPSNYVQSTVSTSIQDRLATIQQQVMSPTRLKKMIDKLHLFPELRGKVSDEVLIQKVQKSTTVDVGGRYSSFRVAYHGENPRQASEIANELAATFIAENLKAREQQFVGTAEFLDHELQETKAQLETREQQLQSIKRNYVMDLPESKQFHLEALNTLRTQLAASQDRVSRAQQDKAMLQSMSAASPTVDLDSGIPGATGGSSPLQKQIQKLEAHLSELQTRYGPNFPDVRKSQAELDRLRKKAAAEGAQELPQPQVATVVLPPSKKNPVLAAQLQKLNQEIDEQTKLQASLQQQIDFHVSKLERVPIFEQQIAGLMRDYDSLRAHYQNLQDKKLSAQMATELEARQKGERFVILDPAPVPVLPFGPNRILISLGGLIAGLFAGIGLAVTFEMLDQSVRSEYEAAHLLGIPVLAGIPQIYTKAQMRSRKLRFALAAVATAYSSSGLGLLIFFAARKMGLL